MKDSRLKTMVFAAMYVALAIVLDYVKQFIPFTSIWENGGSIDIALIPLVFASFHLGWKWGLVTTIVEFIVSILVGGTQLYFAQYNVAVGFLCDYIIPQAIVAFACMFMIPKFRDNPKLKWVGMELGIILVMVIRIACQVISGAYCWMSDGVSAGSGAAWAYSFTYNVSYGIPTLIMLLIVIPLLYKMFEKQMRK